MEVIAGKLESHVERRHPALHVWHEAVHHVSRETHAGALGDDGHGHRRVVLSPEAELVRRGDGGGERDAAVGHQHVGAGAHAHGVATGIGRGEVDGEVEPWVEHEVL